MIQICKQALRSTLMGLMVAVMLCTFAFAANYTHCADYLNELGMLQGGTSGYELDREPTRAEAATMLVRLLGKEEEALATTYAAPFTDVPEWAQPYVGWLYNNGMTTGVTATTYEPSITCTAQMYATFCMRALGYYESMGDFTYDQALNFAYEKGVVNDENCRVDNFLRDDLVAISYTVLSTPTKYGAASLLQELCDAGAVAQETAAPFLGIFEVYNSYRAAFLVGYGYDAKETLTVTDLAVYQNSIMLDRAHMETSAISIRNTYSPDQSQLFAQTKINDQLASQLYYTNGVGYQNLYGATSQQSMTFASALSGLDEPEPLPICQIVLIELRTVDGESHYSISLDPTASSAQLQETATLSGYADDLETMPSVTRLQIDVVFDANGSFSKETLSTSFVMYVDNQPTIAILTMSTSLLSYGSSLQIVFPDSLSTW